MTALPLTPSDHFCALHQACGYLTGILDSHPEYPMLRQIIDWLQTLPEAKPSQSPAVSGETVPSQAEPSAGKTGPEVAGACQPIATPPAPKTTHDTQPYVSPVQSRGGAPLTKGVGEKPLQSPERDGNEGRQDEAGNSVSLKDTEIKAIEVVCPHLSLSDSLFQRLKAVGVIKYPGTMSDRINCLRGLSVEQLRYIRTGVRA